MAKIDRVVRTQIVLRTASPRQQTFSDLMLFGTHAGPRLAVVTDADEMLGANGFGLDETSGLYRAAAVAFGQDPGPDRLFVGRRDFAETATQALAAVSAEGLDWYGLADVAHDPTQTDEIAAWAEANEKLFLATFSDITAGGVARTLNTNRYARTAGWYVRPDVDAWPEVATAARQFCVFPGGETWANVQLNGVPALSLDETLAQQIFALNGNTYEPIRNLAITQNGKTFSGEYIDNIRFRDWLREEIRTRVFQVFVTHDKVPFTDVGIGLIVQAVRGALELGQLRGGIAPDTVDEDTRKIRLGFTVTAPRAYQVSAIDKGNRTLRDVKFTAVLAGAIHNVTLAGELVLENMNFV